MVFFFLHKRSSLDDDYDDVGSTAIIPFDDPLFAVSRYKHGSFTRYTTAVTVPTRSYIAHVKNNYFLILTIHALGKIITSRFRTRAPLYIPV